MLKILVVFGTRPEAIKIAPVIKELEKEELINLKICVTAQHREMLDQVLEFFEIKPDYDLNIMKTSQSLYDITSSILLNLKKVLKEFNPDVIIVQGDTTTTFTASLAAFYQKIKIAHIEAGLRTYDLYSPWPEEANRALTSVLANYHFAPTEKAKKNLIKENKNPNNILVTGNTVIDALFWALKKIEKEPYLKKKIINNIEKEYPFINRDRKIILVTNHRRENFGKGILSICEALKEIAINNPQIDIVYPVHLNPNVQIPVKNILKNIKNIYLINPLSYPEFVYLMKKSYFIITDSGGIQEEAPSLGKPVLVTRNTTEREEAIKAGVIKVVGTDKEKIIKEAQKLINNKEEYEKMAKAINPYGDGKAAKRIKEFLLETKTI